MYDKIKKNEKKAHDKAMKAIEAKKPEFMAKYEALCAEYGCEIIPDTIRLGAMFQLVQRLVPYVKPEKHAAPNDGGKGGPDSDQPSPAHPIEVGQDLGQG